MKSLLLTLPLLFATWFYRGQSPSERGQSPHEWGQSPSERGQSPHQGGQTPHKWGQSPKSVPNWPDSMPIFGEIGEEGMATVRRDGNSVFACFLDPAPPANVLDRATAAYTAAGWEVAPIGTCDMVLLTRGEAVAAVLAEAIDLGTRVTAVQRLITR